MSYSGNSAGGTRGSGFSRFPPSSVILNAFGGPGRRLSQTAGGDEAYSTAPGTTSSNNSAGGTSRSRTSTAARSNFAGPGHRLGDDAATGDSEPDQQGGEGAATQATDANATGTG
ncbi:hypothetical protein B9479_002864 [Cryptococcus floricola]|uniref:Uncharacterized protein n=1 Tax=Cryptococcus floricola TaxID=2591691 RepID=A0A5D3B1N0_9TREE|nr:hypothetical protein B9479_002864 [Cryptococcus floricola]